MPFVLAASVEASCPGNVMVLLLNSSAAGKIRCCKKTLAATNRSTLQTTLLVNYLYCARGPCLNLFEITFVLFKGQAVISPEAFCLYSFICVNLHYQYAPGQQHQARVCKSKFCI